MEFVALVRKNGDSLTTTIPIEICQAMDLKSGELVVVKIKRIEKEGDSDGKSEESVCSNTASV